MNRPGRYRQPKPAAPVHPFKTWEAWRDVHQPFEIDWWKKAIAGGQLRDDAVFDAHWQPVRDWIKPRGRVLDIGPGPRPPFAPCWLIEPLAAAYRDLVPLVWWAGCVVKEAPAEESLHAQICHRHPSECAPHTSGFCSFAMVAMIG